MTNEYKGVGSSRGDSCISGGFPDGVDTEHLVSLSDRHRYIVGKVARIKGRNSLQAVKYAGLKEAINRNRGKVVLVDFWGNFLCSLQTGVPSYD